MAKNDFNLSFVNAFKQMFDGNEPMNGTGSLRFTLPDRKTVGTVALRGGKVEALEVSRHPNYILQRLTSHSMIADANRDMLLQKFKSNSDSPLIPDFARQFMMLPDQIITDAVKEHFLGVLDEMMTWNAVKVEWKSGADDRVLTMPLVSPDKLIDLGQRRAQLLQKIADEYTIEPNQLEDLKFHKLEEVETDDEDVNLILALGSGEYTPADLYRRCGIIPFNSTRELHQLWLDRVVDMLYADQFPLVRPDELNQGVIDATEAEVAAEAEADFNTPAAAIPENDADTAATADETAPEAGTLLTEDFINDDTPGVTNKILSPFDDDEDDEIFAADEFEDQPGEDIDTAEPTPQAAAPVAAVDAPRSATVAAAVGTVTGATKQVPTRMQGFLNEVQAMRDDAQASWDEVVARDEEIQKTQDIIREQQEYLETLQAEREAWNADFEAKRGEYEETVAFLREQLN